jgi:hypothetical protein
MPSFAVTSKFPNRARLFFPLNEHKQANDFFDEMVAQDRAPVKVTELNREDKARGLIPARVYGFTVVYDETV